MVNVRFEKSEQNNVDSMFDFNIDTVLSIDKPIAFQYCLDTEREKLRVISLRCRYC